MNRSKAFRAARRALIAPLVALGVLLGAGTAFAHDVLIGSDPADGASLDRAPTRVTLRFDLPVQTSFSAITVVGPDGGHYENGAAEVDGNSVSAAVSPLGPAGRYTIGFRVVSNDGHPVSGSIGFTLTRAGPGGPAAAPATGAAAPAAEADRDGGEMPVWPWIVGAVLLIGAGAAVALRSGRG